jgi:alkyl hydroperoxide reductase subunit F
MLDAAIQSQLKTYLERLQRPIELRASLDASPAAEEMRALLRDIERLSALVHVREDGEAARRPSFAVGPVGEIARTSFAGVPLGHEFTSLVLAMLHAGGHPPKLETETIEQVRALPGPLAFETYIALSCHNCPDVVQALNLIAALNPGVTHVMVDGARFQDEIARREIMAVPAVYLNGEPFGQGRMTLEEILARLDSGSVARAAAQLDAKAPYDMLVVGGGPAGASAAIYSARKGIRTGIVAERFGGQVLDTLGIENFISVKQTEGPKLVVSLEQHVKDYDVDVMNLQRAKRLVPGADLIGVELENGATLKARSVVLATGARWRELGVPGERQYRNKGVAYCPHCDGPLFKGRRVAVVGGGNSGVEAAIDLANLVQHVTLLEYDARLRADAVLQERLSSLPNVTVITQAATTEVLGDGSKVNGLVYTDRASGESRRIPLEGVFVQIGLLPNTEWLEGTLQLTTRGEIVIDSRGQTSAPGVFAAGDCTDVPFKQIVISMGAGASAALGAFEYLVRLPVAA